MIQNVEEFVYALSIIKSPHSPKPHVHPVKVYYGIRGICFQQPPSRSLDHPMNLPFSNRFRLERLNWSHQRHMNLHVEKRAHIHQSKNVPYTENSSKKKSSCWFPTDLNNNVDQIGSSSPGL